MTEQRSETKRHVISNIMISQKLSDMATKKEIKNGVHCTPFFVASGSALVAFGAANRT